MSVTIASLKYQEAGSALMTHIRDTFSWLQEISVVSGVSGKATVNDIGITGTLLVAADCVPDEIDTALTAKEIELDYFNLAFPISDCDLRQTWLSAFADKYKDEEEVYVDALVPYLAEQIGDEIRAKFHADVIAEATADTAVTKVTLAGGITTPALTYATVQEFIAGLPATFKQHALDKFSSAYYGIDVSVEAYELLVTHFEELKEGYGVSVGGFRISANKELAGNLMVAKSYRNDLLVIDDAEDLAKIKIVEKPWISTSYITTGIAFKGSYVNSERIVISN